MRPRFDVQGPVLQTQNNLSEARTEFYLRDRLTWMRFLGLGLGDPVPDANTICTFREAPTKAGATPRLCRRFDQQLRAQGCLAKAAQRVAASSVAAPKRRTTQAEKPAIRDGRLPEAWQDRPAKLRQKEPRCAPDGQGDPGQAARGRRRRWSTWRARRSATKTTSAPIAAIGRSAVG